MINYISTKTMGENLVLIHGLGNNRLLWKKQHKLGNKFRLIIPELRGHGKTELEDDISLRNFAKDIIEVLESLQVSKAWLCGLSLGGLVAQEINRLRPDLVKGLILANTSAYIPSYIALPLINESSKHYKKDGFVREVAKQCLYDQSYLDEAMQAFTIRDSYIESAKAPLDYNFFFDLACSFKPTMLIGSTSDKVTPLLNIRMMESFKFTNTEVLIFDECGHLSNIEKSEQFNNFVEKFIDKYSK